MEYSLYVIDKYGALSQLEGLDFDVLHDRATTTATGIYPTGIAISPDGRYLATSGYQSAVIVLSLVDFSTVATFDNWGCFGDGLAFSPDGSTLAVVRYSSTQGLTLIDTATWQEVSGVPQISNSSARGGVAFSPDGLRLGIGFGTNDFFKVYNLADWSTAFQPYLGADIRACSFSPDGSLLAVGGAFGLRVFDAAYQLVFSVNISGGVYSVRFSPDGTQLAAGGSYVKVYAVDSWAENLSVYQSGYVQPDWSPDGRFLAFTSGDSPYLLIYDGLTLKTGTAALATAGKQCAWLPNINRPRRDCVLKDHDGNPLSLPVSLLNRENMVRIGRFFPDAVSGEFTAVAHTDGDYYLVVPDTRAGATDDLIEKITLDETTGALDGLSLYLYYAGDLVPLSGNAVNARTGEGIERVIFRANESCRHFGIAQPDASGNWAIDLPPGEYDITWWNDGCAPICHGPYLLELPE